MKILVVSSYLPYPLHSGGHIRLYNILKQLAKNHTITIVCEKRTNQTKEDIEAIKVFCKEIIVIPRKNQWSKSTILRTGFSYLPFLLVGHTLPEMKRTLIAQLRDHSFDLIHVETSYVFQNIPKTYLPIVLAEHNIEYLVYKRYADVAPLPLRPFLYFDVLKLKYWEERFWGKVTKLIAVSEDEKKYMKRDDVAIVPNGVDIQKFSAKGRSSSRRRINKEKRVLFIGDFKWIQNKQAAQWIIEDIWPLLRLMIKDERLKIKLWIVGKNIPQDIKNLVSDDSVILDEDAPEATEKIYQKADVLLAPIKVGGGTSYKILEAMACGLPVVTTPLGLEGISLPKNQDVLVGENEKELADSVILLVQNESVVKKITTNARALIEKKFTWETIAKKLESVYKDAIGN